jgi:hypothetical protein
MKMQCDLSHDDFISPKGFFFVQLLCLVWHLSLFFIKAFLLFFSLGDFDFIELVFEANFLQTKSFSKNITNKRAKKNLKKFPPL